LKRCFSTLFFAFALVTCAGAPETPAQVLKTKIIYLDDCIETFGEKRFVLRTRDEFLRAVRADAGREKCLDSFEHLDFNADSLLGIGLRTGYCRTPVGLRFQTVKNRKEKYYALDVTYIDPQGKVCRAVSHYDLWLLVPKLPAGYEVRFSARALPPAKK
jgi:hypothetical protein